MLEERDSAIIKTQSPRVRGLDVKITEKEIDKKKAVKDKSNI